MSEESGAARGPVRRRLSLLAATAFAAGLISLGALLGLRVRASSLSVMGYGAMVREWYVVGFFPLAVVGVVLGLVGLATTMANRRAVWGAWFAVGGMLLGAWAIVAATGADIMLGSESQRKVGCLANVKDLAAGLGMYCTDWDRFPPSAAWADATRPYWRQEQVMMCPDTVRVRVVMERESYEQLAGEIKQGNWPGSYAYNASLDRMSPDAVIQPDQTVGVFESDRGWNAAGGLGLLPKEPRHLGGENYGFADGHAKWIARGSVTSGMEPYPRWQLQIRDEPR